MLHITLNGIPLQFNTTPSLFSPNGPDAGTLAMLGRVAFAPEDKVLDLGCGWGLVGVFAARQIGEGRVTMADVDPLAVATAKENAALNGVSNVRCLQSDGFRDIDDAGYTLILCNPPYHTDFSVAKHFIEKGFNRLAIGGRLVMVTKRRDWYKNKLASIFGGARVTEAEGYYVFEAEKRGMGYAGR